MAVPAQDFPQPETAIMQIPICRQSFFFGFERRAVPSLLLKNGSHAIRLDGGPTFVAGTAKELQGLEVGVQTLAVIPGFQGCFAEIVESLSNLAGNVGLFAQLERTFKKGKRIAGLAFHKIDIPDIIQAERLVILVANVPLDLQGFFVARQRVVITAAFGVEPAKIDQCDTQSLLVADFPL